MTTRCVVIATETFEPEVGGGETQARTLADELMARGIGVRLVTRRSRPGLPRRERRGALEIIRVAPAGAGRWKKWALGASAFPALLDAARGADAMLVSGFRFLGVPAIVAARLRGVHCFLKADNRGELSGEYFRAGLAKWGLTPRSIPVRVAVGLRNLMLRRAEGFVALSSENMSEYAACGIPAGRREVIPNAVDAERFRPADAAARHALRAGLGLPEGVIIVFTGRLVTHKGLPGLLRVWKEVARDAGDATLVLVGEGGADMHACEPELRRFVREHGLEGRVRFTGAVPNVGDYLRAADAFVFPTFNDSLPLSLLEAMACALPVVTTPVGAIPDFVEDGVNGIMVPVGDEVALEGALRLVIAGGEAIASLGRAARETVVTRFSPQAVADAYLRLFGMHPTPATVGRRA